MGNAPWITIVGLGEDGPEGLSPASREALETAEIIMGPPRHLGLLPKSDAQRIEWPVPFADGIEVLRGLRGRAVAVLVSGDPFWFGAGRAISNAFERDEWLALPAPSVFSIAASRLGWPIEDTLCLGLHSAPLARLRPHLAPGLRAIVLLRDGPAVSALASYLAEQGFGGSALTVCEALGGPRERISSVSVAEARKGGFSHPVCVAIHAAGNGDVVPLVAGRPDDLFETDGVMTKRPVRALTLSALAPRAGEHLWDIGGGSGTIAVEWGLAHPSCSSTVVEQRTDRAVLIRANAAAFGLDRVSVVEGAALDVLDGLPSPDAVFIGGGMSAELLDQIATLPAGTRIVANAVTLESETMLTRAHSNLGGELLRIDIARANALGQKRGWASAYPVVQWSVTL